MLNMTNTNVNVCKPLATPSNAISGITRVTATGNITTTAGNIASTSGHIQTLQGSVSGGKRFISVCGVYGEQWHINIFTNNQWCLFTDRNRRQYCQLMD